MILTAVSRRLASHRMLAVTLATRLSHCDSPYSFLEARKARPSQKRGEGENQKSYCPEAMFLVLQHRGALSPFLSRPPALVNSGCVLLLRFLKHAKVSPKGSHHQVVTGVVRREHTEATVRIKSSAPKLIAYTVCSPLFSPVRQSE